jgi:predicted enzyme related to lactoylglutathione lyase
MQRRRVLGWLPGVLLAVQGLPAVAASHWESAPQAISWLRLGVRDLQRAADFYQTLFGAELRQDAGAATVLRLGSSFLFLQAGGNGELLEQGLLVEAPEAALRQRLQEQGIVLRDSSAAGLLVRDGDGVQTRLGARPDWEAMAAVAGSAPRKPVFDAVLIDELFLNVTNMQVDSMFYARLLEQTSTVVAGSQYFRIGAHARLRLGQAVPGQTAGFNHFAVLVTNTDMEAAAEAVFRAGGIVENILPNGFSFWDPEGLRVVVRSVPQLLESPATRP